MPNEPIDSPDTNLHFFPKYISNTPVGNDLFEGKSQERVAFNVADIIQNNNDCKIIGIEGSWGSGKSNLIAIVQKKLDKQEANQFHFFIYDAWGHQEDLQRRSLLEEITFYLTKKNENNDAVINDEEKWNKKLKELLAKSKETEKKTVPSLSVGIVLSGLVVILTPLFKVLSDLIKYDWLKVLIISIPIILLLILYGYYYLNKTNRENTFKQRIQSASKKLFHIYQQTQKEDITFERISEDEPSVRKFRDWMGEISNDLKSKKLIIVFDNMDRLPNSKVVELWSSIHTFFAENSYDNIKVIILFDRNNIKSAFSNISSNYTDDFINKTFNIVFRVSPPILSDWKKFFEIKWREAFGEIAEDFYKVIQVFDHLSVSKTPREIVVFVNEFVAITQICVDVPHQYIALFIISKKDILEDSDMQIIKPSYLKSLNFLYENDEDLPKYIASLVYQIEPTRALEIVFTQKLTNSLNNNNKDQIKIISESNAFNDILDKAVTQVENYENTVLALKQIEDKVQQKTWNNIYKKLDPPMTSVSDAKIGDYQMIVLDKIIDKKEFLKKTVSLLRDTENFVALDYYNSAKKIDSYLKDNVLNFSIGEFLREKKTAPSDFIALLKATNDKNTYSIICDNSELNDFLDKVDNIDELNNSAYLTSMPDRYSFIKLANSLEAKIKVHESDRSIASSYYTIYKNIAKTPVKVLLQDNFTYTHFVNSGEPRDTFYYDLISMRIAKGDTFQTSYVTYFEDVLSKTDESIVLGLASSIEFFINYGDLLIKITQYDKPLLRATINSLTTSSKNIQKINIVAVLKVIDNIFDCSGIDPETLVKKISQWDYKSVTEAHILDVLKNTTFFKICQTFSTPLTLHCIALANEYFEKLSDELWVQEFENPDSFIVSTSLRILKNQYSTKAVSAIKEVISKIAKGEISIPDLDTWNNIIEKSNKSSIKSVIKDVCVLFVSSREIDAAMFLFFGEWLFEFGEMENNSGSLRRIFRKQVLEDENCVNIILNNPSGILSIYQNGDEKEDFDNEIRVLVSEDKQFVKKIADILNIKIILEK